MTLYTNGGEKARGMVSYAVKRGSIAKVSTLKCVDCGEPAKHYDHRDYGKPLDIEPVCQKCNIRRGPAIPAVDAKPTDYPNKNIYMESMYIKYVDYQREKEGRSFSNYLVMLIKKDMAAKKRAKK